MSVYRKEHNSKAILTTFGDVCYPVMVSPVLELQVKELKQTLVRTHRVSANVIVTPVRGAIVRPW